MFPDIGGAEYLVIGIVILLVVKPKDLPVVMRKIGEWMGKARRLAADFRASFEDMARQSELDDLRREVEAMRAKAADPMGVNTALQETVSDIQQSVGDPYADSTFSHDYAHDAPVAAEEPIVEAKPKRKRAPAKPKKAPIVENVSGPKPRASRKKAV